MHFFPVCFTCFVIDWPIHWLRCLQANNAVIRSWGEKLSVPQGQKLKNHVELVELLGIADTKKGDNTTHGLDKFACMILVVDFSLLLTAYKLIWAGNELQWCLFCSNWLIIQLLVSQNKNAKKIYFLSLAYKSCNKLTFSFMLFTKMPLLKLQKSYSHFL